MFSDPNELLNLKNGLPQTTVGVKAGSSKPTDSTSSSVIVSIRSSTVTFSTTSTDIETGSSTPSSFTEAAHPSDNGLKIGIGVGVGIGVPLGLLLLANFLYIFHLKKRQKIENISPQNSGTDYDHNDMQKNGHNNWGPLENKFPQPVPESVAPQQDLGLNELHGDTLMVMLDG